MAKKNKPKFYTVWKGHNPGVYSTWGECEQQVSRFEGAVYKSFPTLQQAELAFQGASEDYIGKEAERILEQDVIDKFGQPLENSICVDGAWNTATNAIEYQGVSFPERRQIFHAGFPVGTNNIAEFLAIVHALSLCRKNQSDSPIYSDSNTAIAWVKNKHAKTNIERSVESERILLIVKRAEDWLRNNTYTNQVLKMGY